MNPNDPMTEDQRSKLNAMCGDLSKQVPWEVNGTLRRMAKDDWRHFLCAHILNQPMAPSIEGDKFILLACSSKGLTVYTASQVIELAMHFGDSKQVKWKDPKLASYIAEYMERAA